MAPWSGTPPNETFSRTTGLQTGSGAWAATEAASRGIESSDHDVHDQDIAAGINATLKKDGGNKPTANIDFGGFKITNHGSPSSDTDVATKGYVDDTATGFVNATVRAATTANITIATALNNGGSLDGLTLSTNDRVLVKDQTTASQNGIYVVGVSPARATDFDTYNEHVASIVNVSEGTTNGGKSFRNTNNAGGTLNSTSINYLEFGTTLTLPVSVANGGTGQTTASAAFGALKQAATSSATGVVELATTAETITGTDTARAVTPAGVKAALDAYVDCASGMILGTLQARDYRIVINLPFAGTISSTTTRSVSGTGTATFKVNTTALGGTANSVSSTEQTQAHGSSNTFAVGDDLVITLSSVSSLVDLSFTIKFTRS